MKLRTFLIAAGVGLVSLLGLAPNATAMPSHASSNGRVACVAVKEADLGICVGNPMKDLP